LSWKSGKIGGAFIYCLHGYHFCIVCGEIGILMMATAQQLAEKTTGRQKLPVQFKLLHTSVYLFHTCMRF
jgi:hypothetical protein